VLKIGDLVKFKTTGWLFERAEARYCNPGVIIEDVSGVSAERYRIMWADQRVTVEHVCYLKPLTSS